MEIKLASAYFSIGALSGELLSEIASAALEAGMISDSLAVLASEPNTTLRDHEEIFIKCLGEQRINIMTPQDAGLFIAKHHAKNIVDGRATPYNGAKAIIADVVCNLDSVPPEIDAFVGPEDQYMDFADQMRLDYYGKEYCKKARKNMELEIIQAALYLVGNHA